jgi:hypothetical protein
MPARGDVTPSKRRKTKVQDKEKEDWDEESVVGAPAGGPKKKGPQAKDKKIGLVKKKRLVFVPSGRRSCHLGKPGGSYTFLCPCLFLSAFQRQHLPTLTIRIGPFWSWIHQSRDLVDSPCVRPSTTDDSRSKSQL